jgi:hypothetical protein
MVGLKLLLGKCVIFRLENRPETSPSSRNASAREEDWWRENRPEDDIEECTNEAFLMSMF